MKIKNTKSALASFAVDSRFYDRLNAACTVLLAAGVLALIWIAAAPKLGPGVDSSLSGASHSQVEVTSGQARGGDFIL